MPGRNFNANSYKYGFGGKENDNEIKGSGNSLDFGERINDPRLGRWLSVDPLASNFPWQSPYTSMDNNPIYLVDPTGMGTESTHTDKNGKVIAVYDDGDNGVYKHNDVSKWNGKSTLGKTGDGIAKMGETQYWDEFSKHNSKGEILGDKNGNFGNPEAHINFDKNVDGLVTSIVGMVKRHFASYGSASAAKDWLQTNSKRGALLDIKSNLGEEEGYQFNGKYYSGESVGNYLFGANVESLRGFANLDNLRYPFTNKESVFYRSAEAFGAYHNKSNKVNNPSVKPYYGEIPYSGRNVVLGYYGGKTDNAIFKAHGNAAIYGTKTTK